jgi:hypothetical protein
MASAQTHANGQRERSQVTGQRSACLLSERARVGVSSRQRQRQQAHQQTRRQPGSGNRTSLNLEPQHSQRTTKPCDPNRLLALLVHAHGDNFRAAAAAVVASILQLDDPDGKGTEAAPSRRSRPMQERERVRRQQEEEREAELRRKRQEWLEKARQNGVPGTEYVV